MDDADVTAARAGFLAVADETDIAGRIAHAVRADRRVGDDGVIGAYTAVPIVGVRIGGPEVCARLGRLGEIEQETGRAGAGIVEDKIVVTGQCTGFDRPAAGMDKFRSGVETWTRVGRRSIGRRTCQSSGG